MAPELFQDGGVYSFYSDFWSLGCVLCELATGHPPFVATYFNELAKLILNVKSKKLIYLIFTYNAFFILFFYFRFIEFISHYFFQTYLVLTDSFLLVLFIFLG